ncbi:unnamed protein product [Trichobilharzia szidati]|nr:unnamed protein product [Trichobilharzia szidati]
MGRKIYPSIVEDCNHHGYYIIDTWCYLFSYIISCLPEVYEAGVCHLPINSNSSTTLTPTTSADFMPIDDSVLYYENSSLSTQITKTPKINYYGDYTCSGSDDDGSDASEYYTAISQIPCFDYRQLNSTDLFNSYELDILYYFPSIQSNLKSTHRNQSYQILLSLKHVFDSLFSRITLNSERIINMEFDDKDCNMLRTDDLSNSSLRTRINPLSRCLSLPSIRRMVNSADETCHYLKTLYFSNMNRETLYSLEEWETNTTIEETDEFSLSQDNDENSYNKMKAATVAGGKLNNCSSRRGNNIYRDYLYLRYPITNLYNLSTEQNYLERFKNNCSSTLYLSKSYSLLSGCAYQSFQCSISYSGTPQSYASRNLDGDFLLFIKITSTSELFNENVENYPMKLLCTQNSPSKHLKKTKELIKNSPNYNYYYYQQMSSSNAIPEESFKEQEDQEYLPVNYSLTLADSDAYENLDGGHQNDSVESKVVKVKTPGKVSTLRPSSYSDFRKCRPKLETLSKENIESVCATTVESLESKLLMNCPVEFAAAELTARRAMRKESSMYNRSAKSFALSPGDNKPSERKPSLIFGNSVKVDKRDSVPLVSECPTFSVDNKASRPSLNLVHPARKSIHSIHSNGTIRLEELNVPDVYPDSISHIQATSWASFDSNEIGQTFKPPDLPDSTSSMTYDTLLENLKSQKRTSDEEDFQHLLENHGSFQLHLKFIPNGLYFTPHIHSCKVRQLLDVNEKERYSVRKSGNFVELLRTMHGLRKFL